MSYRIEQNDNDIFFILYDIYEDFIFSLLKTEEKIKIMKNVLVQAIFTGKIFYR
jgi:hypothetical protein